MSTVVVVETMLRGICFFAEQVCLPSEVFWALVAQTEFLHLGLDGSKPLLSGQGRVRSGVRTLEEFLCLSPFWNL